MEKTKEIRGLAGIHVEILKDVSFRITPITARDAGEMVRSIRGYPLLQGYRGHAEADIAGVEDVLLRIARLVEEVSEISELDLNPVIALPPGQGCVIIDTRIRVPRCTSRLLVRNASSTSAWTENSQCYQSLSVRPEPRRRTPKEFFSTLPGLKKTTAWSRPAPKQKKQILPLRHREHGGLKEVL